MKRITAILIAVILVLSAPVISFADDIYIIEDEEENYIPEVPTTKKSAETTTASGSDSLLDGSLLGDIDIEGYFGDLSGMFGDGIDSIVSGFEGAFGDFDLGGLMGEDDGGDEQLQPIQPETPVTVKPAVTTSQDKQNNEKQTENNSGGSTTQQQQNNEQKEELPSVLIVNQGGASDDRISGSTLTLLVFIAAIVIIIITGAIVLVIMTKRTEYNSQVKSRSTIPSVSQPDALAQFMDDGIIDDGKDYGNITYWNKE